MKNSRIKINKKEQMNFFRRLAFLTQASISLKDSLVIMSSSGTSKKIQTVYAAIINTVSEGNFLHVALSHFPKSFNSFSVNIAKIAEETGQLSQNLKHISQELEKQGALKRKVMSALIYPIVIATSALGLTLFLILVIFPKIQTLFSTLDVSLPITTRVIMYVSSALIHYWPSIIISSCGFIMGTTIVITKWSRARYIKDYLILNLPIVGTVVRTYNVAILTRTMGSLLASGLRIERMLEITRDMCPHLVYKKAMGELATAVSAGTTISDYLILHKNLFPGDVAYLVQAAEISGTLPETLTYISESYDQNVEHTVKNISSLLEPSLMVGMGLIVGTISLSIISPIYELTQSIS